MQEEVGLKSHHVKDYYPMECRILILHPYGMSKSDPFVEGLRRIFDANPELKPAAVSVRAGLDNSTIRKLISGANSSPKIETANRIAQAMGYDLADVIAVGSHQDPAMALDWLRLLDIVSPEIRDEAVKYALFLQSQNLSAQAGRFSHPPDDGKKMTESGEPRDPSLEGEATDHSSEPQGAGQDQRRPSRSPRRVSKPRKAAS